MTNKTVSATKRYQNSPFILTDRKISRVVEVAKERLDRVKGEGTLREEFTVTFGDEKELKLDSLDKVLSLDNSKKNPVRRVSMQFSLAGPLNLPHAIHVTFDGNDSDGSEVSLSVVSSDLGWMQETMGAQEEQLERSIPTGFIYAIKKHGTAGFIFALIIIGMLGNILGFVDNKVGPMKIAESRVAELSVLSANAKSDHEKQDFVFQYLASTLPGNEKKPDAKALFSDSRTYLVGIPLLIGILSTLAAIVWYYPKTVFSWGDCAESYERMLERRKFLWYGVVVALVIGVLGNLFVMGVTSIPG